ncbi:MAG: terminase gpA endonuclease subunit, partial [Thermodesulfobacteriota bacterium]
MASPALATDAAAQSALPGIPAAGQLRLRLRPWMPPAWRRAAAGKEIELRIPELVVRRCKKPRRIHPSEWSVRHRRMPAAEAHPGAYRPEFARYAAKVMDTWAQPWVREVWYCAVDQASKTNTMLSCLGWLRTYAPGNVFYQMPDAESSDRIMGRKLIPMFRVTPSLARHLSPRADDTAHKGITFADGMAILPSWSGSLTSTAVFSARYTFSDEVDKMRMIGSEADPIDRIKKRTRTNRFSKHFFASTPAGAWIYKGTMACQQVWAAAARCPHCGALVVMDEEHMDIPEGATEESIKADPGGVGYLCNACGEHWDEAERTWAYHHGDWVCIQGAEHRRPSDVGFLLSAFPLPDVPLAQIARTILRAKAGDLSARRDLAHGIQARDYEEALADRKEDQVLRLRDDRPEGLVPSGPIAAVTAVADMQKRGFWFSVRAWGFGLEQESWLLKAGFVDSWEALRQLFFESEFADVQGGRHVVTLRGIDSGGGESEPWADLSRTAEAYLWAYAHPGVLLFKGLRTMSSPYRMSHQDRIPGTNRPLPGAVPLYLLNTKHYKDRLAAKLLVEPGNPGAWHLHSGYTPDQLALLARDPGARVEHGLHELARQLCVEGRDDKGFWQNPKNRANHLWDASYMELALVDIAQVKLWKPPAAQRPPAAPAKPA